MWATAPALLAVLAAPGVPATAVPAEITIGSVTTAPGHPEVLVVQVDSTADVEAVNAVVRDATTGQAESDVSLTFDDASSTWRSAAMTLPLGQHTAEVTAVDADNRAATSVPTPFSYLLQPIVVSHQIDTTPLDPEHRSVQAQGVLGLYDPRTQTQAPAAGAVVRLRLAGTGVVQEDATVRSDGRYFVGGLPEVGGGTDTSLTVPAQVSWLTDPSTTADLADSAHGSAFIDDVSIPATRRSARIVLDSHAMTVRPPALAPISGTLQQWADGAWKPLRRFPVSVPYPTGGRATSSSNDNGRFTVNLQALQDGSYEAVLGQSLGTHWLVNAADVRDSVLLNVIDHVTLSWSQPGIDDEAVLSVYGELTTSSGKPSGLARVYVEQSSTGTSGWTKVGSVLSSSSGWFGGKVTLTNPAGYFRLTNVGSASLQPSTSRVVHLIRVDSRIIGFNASPEPIRKGSTLSVAGTLQVVKSGRFAHVGSNQPVSIYFLARGARTPTYKGYTRTTSNGTFRFRTTATTDGTWSAAWLPKSGTYVNAHSSTDYVDVR